MFENKELNEHFDSVKDFKILSKDSFLIVDDEFDRNTWILPYKNKLGEIVKPFVEQYLDIFFDAESKEFIKKYEKEIVILKDLAKELKIPTNIINEKIESRKKKEGFTDDDLLFPLSFSNKGYVEDYDTLLNLRFRIQMLLREDISYINNVQMIFSNNTIILRQGSSLRAKFICKKSHTFYMFGIQKTFWANPLTKRYFKELWQ